MEKKCVIDHKVPTHANQHAVSQIIDASLDEFLLATPGLPFYKKSRLLNIQRCYRREFGFSVYECDSCKMPHLLPATCGSAVCPKCSFHRRQTWLANRANSMPPVSYFHAVFTVPFELRGFFVDNVKLANTALFRAVSKTISDVIEKKGGPGSEGIYSLVLHTWNQKLLPHFHIHAIVGAGYFREKVWHDTESKYFANFDTLAKNYRQNLESELLDLAENGEKSKISKFEKYHQYLHDNGKPPLTKSGKAKPKPTEPIYPLSPSGVAELKRVFESIEHKKSKVFAEPITGGVSQVIEYLAAYTYKFGISDKKLDLNHEAKTVTIAINTRDQKERQVPGPKEITISFIDFLNRFVIHLLPKGFRRVRHYGVLQGPKSKVKLRQILESLHEKGCIDSSNKIYASVVLGLIQQPFKVEIPCQACDSGILLHLLTRRKRGLSFDKISNDTKLIEAIVLEARQRQLGSTVIPIAQSPPLRTQET